MKRIESIDYITPALQAMAVPIESVRLDPRNARKHNDRNRDSIRFSLSKFGQQKPISVDADGIILAGNGTYSVAVELGWKYIAAVKSHLGGAQARAYAIADNRTAELAEWDLPQLMNTIDQLRVVEFDLDGMGFGDQDIDQYLQTIENTSQLAVKHEDGAANARFTVDCRDEADQLGMIARFKGKNLKCRPLIS